MTFLEIVQSVCRSVGLPVPTQIVGATDAAPRMYLGLLEDELDDVSVRDNFTPLQRQCVFTTAAAPLQGLMTALIPNDTVWKVISNSFFDRTSHLRVAGPVSEEQWQMYEALHAGMLPRFRFWQGGLYLQPDPPAGHQMAFEYLSQNCVVDGGTGVYKRQITADNDTFLIPDEVMKAALKWRYKAEKQLSYSEDFARYERTRASLFMNSSPKPDLDLAGKKFPSPGPGLIVSPGSWPLS